MNEIRIDVNNRGKRQIQIALGIIFDTYPIAYNLSKNILLLSTVAEQVLSTPITK